MYRNREAPARSLRIAMALALSAGVLFPATSAAAAEGYDRTGEASWYGERYHGRPTASGAPFDMNGLTAAHRHLPFGTLVRVTNLENERTVFVRIADRGPYARGRIVDLSRRAAELLGFVEDGVARVRVRVEREASPPAFSGNASYAMPVALRPPPGVNP